MPPLFWGNNGETYALTHKTRVDFAGLNQAVIGQLPTLLAEYLPEGRIVGHEWVCGDIQGGAGDSCKTSLTSGKGSDFATGEGWTDLVQLVSKQRRIAMLEAARMVAKRIGFSLNGGNSAASTPKAPRKPPQRPAEPIPVGAPSVPDHWELGPATASYAYEAFFVQCRYERPDGSKQFTPWTWRGGKWSPKAWPDPKPLFGRELLESRPDVPVLVVEGEKCALAARTLFPSLVVVTWSGGANQVLKSDWTPLAGRKVEIWPDADEAGKKAAAQLAALLLKIGAARIRVVDVTGQPAGWDVADAITQGWDVAKTHAWVKDRLRLVENRDPESPATDLIDAPAATSPIVIESAAPSSLVSWQSLGLDCNEGGSPFATIANASAIILMHPQYAKKIYLDTFRQQVFHTLRSALPVPWTDADTRSLTVQIQQQLKIPKMSISIIHEALMHASTVNGRNTLTDWLDSLVWDDIPRLDDWLVDTLGVPKTPYTIAVSHNWPVGMVARAYRPGCQVDTMPVLEGKMGRGKSSFLERLASPWFAALPTGFGDKDFLQALQGQWLVEIPDMSAFSKREHSHILATITIRIDRYRASYGRITENHPRIATFAATSESDVYLQSSAGTRRYLPLRCNEINLDALELIRDQVFAEAVHEFKQGAQWWEFPDAEAQAEQGARVVDDPWYSRIENYVSGQSEVTSDQLLSAPECLDIPVERQTQREVLRVGSILRTLKWRRTVKKIGSRSVRVWRPPALA